MAKKRYCTICKINRNMSGTKGLCRTCALTKGFKSCGKCNKVFTPKRERQRNCSNCLVNSKVGWEIGPGGPVGRGKRQR